MKIALVVIGLLIGMTAIIGMASALDGVGIFARHGDEYWTRADYEHIGSVKDRVSLFARPGEVYPGPTDSPVNETGNRWERPARPDWINETSIISGINRIDSPAVKPVYLSRLPGFL